MHIYFYLRGITEFVDLTKAFLKSQYWKWHLPDGKYMMVQGGLRESVLGVQEYIIPETALPEFLAMMNIQSSNDIGVSDKKMLHKFKLATLRKILGCKKVSKESYEEAEDINPNTVLNNFERGLSEAPLKNVSVHLIGIKEDRKDDDGVECL